MAKKELIIISDYSQVSPLSLNELCEICGVSSDIITKLIEYEIIQPRGNRPEEWEFDLNHLQRAKVAIRLQRDLEVNMPGIALVLDLLDEMDEMRSRLAVYEKYFTN